MNMTVEMKKKKNMYDMMMITFFYLPHFFLPFLLYATVTYHTLERHHHYVNHSPCDWLSRGFSSATVILTPPLPSPRTSLTPSSLTPSTWHTPLSTFSLIHS
eukprot:Sspe_Gene.27868::Locus_12275_Transcript_1_1_Confidence_1.000_Length_704::g.27868::m.27868